MTPFSKVSAISQSLVSAVAGCVGIRKSRTFSRSFLAESRKAQTHMPKGAPGTAPVASGKVGTKVERR